jgi:2-oxo-4-hydroxy-4-carboxy-5-ureidoimidazoline decarboxylase
MGTEGLTCFNDLPTQAAQEALLQCCGARRWAQQMAAARPYASAWDAIEQSDAIVAGLGVDELAEALAGHPRIGARPDSNPHTSQDSARAAAWSSQEQAGVEAASGPTRQALTAANLEYEERFGHIYLVCAAGRTGKELLALLRGRLQNDPEDEWQVVRAELQKINALRLERLLAGSP